jgi:di/tricarboxylate transporter
VAAFAGVAVLVLARIVTPDQIYRAIDWRIIALIGGITPLSIALDHTGFTADVSHTMVAVLGPLGPYALAAAFYWLAALLTQVISNVAAALVLAPLALSIAHANAWSPYPLLIMMIVALSAAPLTPLANKVFLMAMGPGQYRYQDFIRVGGPVTLVMFTLSLVLVPLMFPFVVAH